jgi:hypothetical protein
MLTRTCEIQYLLFVFMNSLLLDDKNAAAVVLRNLTTAISFSAPLADITLLRKGVIEFQLECSFCGSKRLRGDIPR